MTMPQSGGVNLSQVNDRVFGKPGNILLTESKVRDYLGVQSGNVNLLATKDRALGAGRINVGKNPSSMQMQTDVDTSTNGNGNTFEARIVFDPNPSWQGKVVAQSIWNARGAQYLCGYFYCHPDVTQITVTADCKRHYNHRPSTGGDLKLQVRGFADNYLSGSMSEFYNDRIMNYYTDPKTVIETMSVSSAHPHVQVAFQVANNAGQSIPNTESGIGFQISNLRVTCQ